MRLLPLFFTARTKSLLVLRPITLAKGLAVSLSKQPRRCRSCLTLHSSGWRIGGTKSSSLNGIVYSVLTGICVGAGTIAFFLLFQRGGPLSSVPAILAGGAAIMAVAGILFFREPPSWQRIVGIAFAVIGLFLLSK